jgi:hypothetical protein
MASEAGAATPPPALAVVAALADDDRLAPLLTTSGGGSLAANGLLSEAWRALGAQFASPATRAAALNIAESLIEQAEAARFDADRAKNEREQLARAAGAEAAEAEEESERFTSKKKGRSKGGGKEAAEKEAMGKQSEEEAEEKEHVSVTLLRDHAPALLEALQAALAARAARGRHAQVPGSNAAAAAGSGRSSAAVGASVGAAGRELAVLKRLGPLLGQAAASGAIADTLVPVLAIKRLDESAVTEVLNALSSVVPSADAHLSVEQAAEVAAAAARHRSALAPLFGRLRQRHARRALVAAVRAIAAHDPAAAAAAPVLADLHADSRDSIEGVDYDKRLSAYENLDQAWFASSPTAAAVPILHHVIHELRGSDLALRHAAAAALERFLDAAVAEYESQSSRKGGSDAADGLADDEEEEEDNSMNLRSAVSRAAAAAAASEASLAGAVMGVLAPGVKGLLRSPEATTRSEALAIFRRLALTWWGDAQVDSYSFESAWF